MNQDVGKGRSGRSGAPWFVISCAVGFLIISGCVVYFVVKFFI
jgi:hypothetical protein